MGGSTFPGRLKAGMVAAGIVSLDQLARRIMSLRGNGPIITRSVILEWQTTEGRSMSADDLLDCCEAMNIRPRWLKQGRGTMTPVVRGSWEALTLMTLERIPEAHIPDWLKFGRRLTRM